MGSVKEEAQCAGVLQCRPAEGLVYTYRILYTSGGYPYVEAVAEDERGVRREKSGAFPMDGRLARAFLAMLVQCEVSPLSLVEVYDEFLTLHPL